MQKIKGRIKIFIFDVETLGVESNAVILSAALIHFDVEKRPTYQDLLDDDLHGCLEAPGHGGHCLGYLPRHGGGHEVGVLRGRSTGAGHRFGLSFCGR